MSFYDIATRSAGIPPPPSKKVFWIVIILIAALLIYIYFTSNSSTVAVNTAGVPIDTSSNAPAITATTNPVTGQTLNTYLAGNGTIQVPSAVVQWAQTLPPNNQAQFFKMLPSMTQTDISGLMDLIINLWGKSATFTTAQISFWDNWRQTYHINDGTILN